MAHGHTGDRLDAGRGGACSSPRAVDGQRPGGERGWPPSPDELAVWTSHELKTPLGAAMAASDLAERALRGGDAPETAKQLARVRRQLARMREVVGTVLDARRLEAGHPGMALERIELRPYVEEVVASWRDMHPERTFVVVAGAAAVEADRAFLRGILDNLLSNAVKYGPPEDAVRIEVSAGEGSVSVAVRDGGPGVPAGEVASVFDRFRRGAGRREEGHGLGLHVAGVLAERHGGRIDVSSSADGCAFTIVLPAPR